MMYSLKRLAALASTIAQSCIIGDIVTLNGPLGAGKTTFSQHFIQTLNPSANVTSPTFNIVKTYGTAICEIWHFDLYRLNDTSEIYEIGLEEALTNGISIIEWPDIAKSFLPKERCLDIYIDHTSDANLRNVELRKNHRWNSKS